MSPMEKGAGRRSNLPSIAYCLWHELSQFVTQTRLSLASREVTERTLHEFRDGQDRELIEGDHPVNELSLELREFVTRAAALVESYRQSDSELHWIDGVGLAVQGVGLERRIIANELCQRYNAESSRQIWQRDVCNILSFYSQMSQKRYEGAPPHLTVAYYPSGAPASDFGVLGKALLDEYKGLVPMLRDPHTVVVTQKNCRITNILDNRLFDAASASIDLPPVPPRLAHLQQLTLPGAAVRPVIFNLNPNGTLEILGDGKLVFRKVNNRWRFLDAAWYRQVIRDEIDACGGDLVPHNFLTLGMDLADRAEGALLFLCAEPTDGVLNRLLHPRESLIRTSQRQPYQELTARSRFTVMVGRRDLSLGDKMYHHITPLLRDICGIDGATVFSYGGELLGFGCIVRLSAGSSARVGGEVARLRSTTGKPLRGDGPALEGARSNAAIAASRWGVAAKISSDGEAWLWIGGRAFGCFC